MSVYMQVIIF